MARPPRLVDLHCDWLLQYVPDCTVFDPAFYPEIAAVAGRPEGTAYLAQVDGYLTGTAAAVIACYRRSEEWARQRDTWASLAALIARVEAEFPGRLLIGPDDLTRWAADPDGLCWAVIGVEGFDHLVRNTADLDRLPRLFERGVRVFQPVYGSASLLAGSSEAGDVRGLTELGEAFLQVLADLVTSPTDPRPVVDLAHLNPGAMSDVLTWLEADAVRAGCLLPAYSHGSLSHEAFTASRALTLDNLARLRRLGGTVGFSLGPPFFDSVDRLRAAIESAASLPFLGEPGYTGIAIGSDFLGVEKTLPSLANAEQVATWLAATFDPPIAAALIQGNARSLLRRAAGG